MRLHRDRNSHRNVFFLGNNYSVFWQGCDIEKDAVVLKRGEKLGVSEIGLLATVGVMMVKVLFCFAFL